MTAPPPSVQGPLPSLAGARTGRRRDSRLRVELPARLLTLTANVRASLCDLSQSGARLRHEGPLDRGEEGVLRWLEFETFGQIVWSRGGFAGLEFDGLLAPAILLETRDRADYGLVPDEKREAYARARDWYRGYR